MIQWPKSYIFSVGMGYMCNVQVPVVVIIFVDHGGLPPMMNVTFMYL